MHFLELTGIDCQAAFARSVRHIECLHDYMASKNRKRVPEVEEACRASSSQSPKVAGMILHLLEYFKDSEEALMFLIDVSFHVNYKKFRANILPFRSGMLF